MKTAPDQPQETFRLARLVKGKKKRWYIEFYAMDPIRQVLTRKRLYKIPGDSWSQKEFRAKLIIKEINRQLKNGFVLKVDPSAVPVEEQKNETISTEPPKPATIADLFRLGVDVAIQGKRHLSQKSYSYTAKRLLNYTDSVGLSGQPWEAMTRAELKKWIDHEKKSGLSNQTCNNLLQFFRAIANCLLERELIRENPAIGIKMMHTEAERHAAISEADVKLLRSWMLEHDVPLYVVTQTIYYTFIRPVELSRLQGRHLDLKNRVILMESAISKNKKSQHVTIPGPLLEIFRKYGFDKAAPNDYIFGKGLWLSTWSTHPNRYSGRHLQMIKALELERSGYDLYSWKHTGVCAAYRAGLDIVSIKEQCRHYSIEETYTYMRSLGLILNKEIMEKEW